VTNFPERYGWRKEEIYQEYHGGAKERASQLGFRLQEFWLREGRMTPARASQILAARGIAGLLMAPQPTPAETVELEWDRFVAVTIGYSLVRPQLHMVCPNQYRCMRIAMNELVGRDYRRIGLVMLRESDERVDHNWLAGYLVAQQALAPDDRLEPLLLPKWDEKLLGQWLRRCRPDAIVSKCAQTLPALRRLGYELPRDLGLVSLTQVRSTRGLAGVDESAQEVGAAAVDYLSGMLQRNERGVPGQPRRLLIEGRWCEGGTLRPPLGVSR
jgi:DNA-binding LacI/PurR family transcriptional regulator